MIHQPTVHVWTKFQLCVPLSPWEKKDDFFLFENWRERNMKKLREELSRRNLVLFQNKQMIHNTCTKLQNPTCNSFVDIFVKNFPMYYTGVRDGKKGETRQNKSEFCFSVPQYTWPLSMCIQNLKTGSHRWLETCNRIFVWRERLIRGMIGSRMLILFYTIQQVIPNICTKFQNPRHSSFWEIVDTNFPMYYIWVRDGKMEKKAKFNHRILVLFPTIYLVPPQDV